MIVYNKYINGEDFTWYDSSNVIFSKCYDNNSVTKTLKIVFKNGRTYLYKDVSTDDYVAFKTASSNGSAINTYIIKKYQGARISDTDIDKLQELQNNFKKDENKLNNEKLSNIIYHIDICSKNGEIQMKMDNKPVYTAIEGKISIFDVLRAMNIKYSYSEVDNIENETDEQDEEIKL